MVANEREGHLRSILKTYHHGSAMAAESMDAATVMKDTEQSAARPCR
jgi:hypothetical protein